MKQMEVSILGQSYLLGCPEGGETALEEAVASVDREMSAIRDGGKVRSRERIAVLAALNLAYALAARASVRSPGAELPQRAEGAPATDPDGPDLDALIRRIDHALNADGQLL